MSVIHPDTLEGELARLWSTAEYAAIRDFAARCGMSVEEVILEQHKKPGGVCDQVGISPDDYTAADAAFALATARSLTPGQLKDWQNARERGGH